MQLPELLLRLQRPRQVIDYVSTFRAKYNDNPLWITEVAPGQVEPVCSIG